MVTESDFHGHVDLVILVLEYGNQSDQPNYILSAFSTSVDRNGATMGLGIYKR